MSAAYPSQRTSSSSSGGRNSSTRRESASYAGDNIASSSSNSNGGGNGSNSTSLSRLLSSAAGSSSASVRSGRGGWSDQSISSSSRRVSRTIGSDRKSLSIRDIDALKVETRRPWPVIFNWPDGIDREEVRVPDARTFEYWRRDMEEQTKRSSYDPSRYPNQHIEDWNEVRFLGAVIITPQLPGEWFRENCPQFKGMSGVTHKQLFDKADEKNNIDSFVLNADTTAKSILLNGRLDETSILYALPYVFFVHSLNSTGLFGAMSVPWQSYVVASEYEDARGGGGGPKLRGAMGAILYSTLLAALEYIPPREDRSRWRPLAVFSTAVPARDEREAVFRVQTLMEWRRTGVSSVEPNLAWLDVPDWSQIDMQNIALRVRNADHPPYLIDSRIMTALEFERALERAEDRKSAEALRAAEALKLKEKAEEDAEWQRGVAETNRKEREWQAFMEQRERDRPLSDKFYAWIYPLRDRWPSWRTALVWGAGAATVAGAVLIGRHYLISPPGSGDNIGILAQATKLIKDRLPLMGSGEAGAEAVAASSVTETLNAGVDKLTEVAAPVAGTLNSGFTDVTSAEAIHQMAKNTLHQTIISDTATQTIGDAAADAATGASSIPIVDTESYADAIKRMWGTAGGIAGGLKNEAGTLYEFAATEGLDAAKAGYAQGYAETAEKITQELKRPILDFTNTALKGAAVLGAVGLGVHYGVPALISGGVQGLVGRARGSSNNAEQKIVVHHHHHGGAAPHKKSSPPKTAAAVAAAAAPKTVVKKNVSASTTHRKISSSLPRAQEEKRPTRPRSVTHDVTSPASPIPHRETAPGETRRVSNRSPSVKSPLAPSVHHKKPSSTDAVTKPPPPKRKGSTSTRRKAKSTNKRRSAPQKRKTAKRTPRKAASSYKPHTTTRIRTSTRGAKMKK